MCVERDFVFRTLLRTNALAVVSFLVVYFNHGKKFRSKIKLRLEIRVWYSG